MKAPTSYTGWEKESRQSTSRAALYRGHSEKGRGEVQEASLIPFFLSPPCILFPLSLCLLRLTMELLTVPSPRDVLVNFNPVFREKADVPELMKAS